MAVKSGLAGKNSKKKKTSTIFVERLWIFFPRNQHMTPWQELINSSGMEKHDIELAQKEGGGNMVDKKFQKKYTKVVQKEISYLWGEKKRKIDKKKDIFSGEKNRCI